MSESKYQILHWKKWKATSLLLKETKEELYNNVKAIGYDNSLPGGPHKTIFERYNKLREMLDKYDEHIQMYDTMVNRLEKCIAELLDQEKREVVIIYANYPERGQSFDREMAALEKGYSRASFYRIALEAFNILDTVLELKEETDTKQILNKEKNKI